MSGISGASVFLVDDEAIKVGYDDRPNRVQQQGQWLLDNAHDRLPTVFKIMTRGYAMEQLNPIATSEVQLDRMLEALDTCVWQFDPVHKVDTPRTLLKVSLILDKHAPHLLQPATDRVSFIRETVACLTHGDPTAENVMLRGGDYVMIDPLPSTEAIPDDMAVDVGKLLQSANGWEEMKGDERASFKPDAVAEHFKDDVFEVGQLWCIVHFIRTLPYAVKEVRPHVVEKLEELLGL